MLNIDFFDLLYSHLEERSCNNVCANLSAEADYQNDLKEEAEKYQTYKALDLSKSQHQVIEEWVNAIHTQNTAYAMVLFRIGMKYGFSLMMQLGSF